MMILSPTSLLDRLHRVCDGPARTRTFLRSRALGTANLAALIAALLCRIAVGEEAWKAKAAAQIEQYRKGDFEVQVSKPDGSPLANAEVGVSLKRHAFLFGTAVNGTLIRQNIPASKKYRDFVATHFNAITAENAMKWSAIEPTPGARNFEDADAVARFAAESGLALRGHCILWGEPQFLQQWIRDLPPEEVRSRSLAHAKEMASRYAGKVICWDVINELVTGDWFGQVLPPSFKLQVFETVHAADPKALLFLNEMQVLHNDQYLQRMLEIAAGLKAEGIPLGGIGVQEHDAHEVALERPQDPNAPPFRRLPPETIWSRLDQIATLGLPIHLTEISAGAWDLNMRADALETLLRVAFAHPAVEGFFVWGFQEGQVWKANAFLVNGDGSLNEAGKRVFGLWEKEWTTDLTVKTDAKGIARFRGFYGSYEVRAPKAGAALCNLSKSSPDAKVALNTGASKSR